jgi:imidazolonepropionase
MATADLLVTHASELVTLASGPRFGPRMDDLAIIENGALAVKGERIVAVGKTEDVLKNFAAPTVISAEGRCVLPGFVDAHTHPIFAGFRDQEFDLRLRGTPYQEIARQGGGIMSSVRGLREMSYQDLRARLQERFDNFLRHGTTTIEAKSGYGLSGEHEIRSLVALADVARQHPLEVAATFLGAHDCGPEFGGNRAGYLEHLAQEVLPQVSEQSLAEFCDIFCDVGVFAPEESLQYLMAAQKLGFRLRVHADELGDSGGSRIAADLHASSADHLIYTTSQGIARLKAAHVSPVLLPGTVLSLGSKRMPDARAMIEAGLPVVIATDFNPGTCPTQSMPAMIVLACQMLRLTVAEAISASTINAASSLGRERLIGSLEVGKQADLIVIRSPTHLALGSRFDWDPIEITVKRGRVVHRAS